MKPGDRVYNILTVVFLVLTAASCLCMGTVALIPPGIIPYVGGPTFPAPLTVPTLALALPTETAATEVSFPTLPPEWTATITRTATNVPPTRTVGTTSTEGPTSTRTPFPTGVGFTATASPTDRPSATPAPPTATPRPTQGGSYPPQRPTNTVPPSTAYP